jgi:hypothetical protein
VDQRSANSVTAAAACERATAAGMAAPADARALLEDRRRLLEHALQVMVSGPGASTCPSAQQGSDRTSSDSRVRAGSCGAWRVCCGMLRGSVCAGHSCHAACTPTPPADVPAAGRQAAGARGRCRAVRAVAAGRTRGASAAACNHHLWRWHWCSGHGSSSSSSRQARHAGAPQVLPQGQQVRPASNVRCQQATNQVRRSARPPFIHTHAAPVHVCHACTAPAGSCSATAGDGRGRSRAPSRRTSGDAQAAAPAPAPPELQLPQLATGLTGAEVQDLAYLVLAAACPEQGVCVCVPTGWVHAVAARRAMRHVSVCVQHSSLGSSELLSAAQAVGHARSCVGARHCTCR